METNEPLPFTYQPPAIKAYLPHQVPEKIRQTVCTQQAEFFDTEDLKAHVEYWRGDLLKAQGIETYLVEGWQLYGQGMGVSLRFQVTDLKQWLKVHEETTGLGADDRERILRADKEGEVKLYAEPDQTPYSVTRGRITADMDPDTARTLTNVLEKLTESWLQYVAKEEKNALDALTEEYEARTSWEAIKENLESMDQMVTETGEIVSASECVRVP